MPDDPKPQDVNVSLAKEVADLLPGKPSFAEQMKAVGVYGVGTVLIVLIVPAMMFLLYQLVMSTIPANTTALTKVAEQGEDVEKSFNRNSRMLDKVAAKLGEEPDE